MQLNSLQLECQRLGADMTLSFGCLVSARHKGESVVSGEKYNSKCYGLVSSIKPFEEYGFDIDFYCNFGGSTGREKSLKIVGHPIDRGRLCYLSQDCKTVRSKKARNTVEFWFKQSIDLLQKDILERDEKTLEYVKLFLLSIKQDNRE